MMYMSALYQVSLLSAELGEHQEEYADVRVQSSTALRALATPLPP